MYRSNILATVLAETSYTAYRLGLQSVAISIVEEISVARKSFGSCC